MLKYELYRFFLFPVKNGGALGGDCTLVLMSLRLTLLRFHSRSFKCRIICLEIIFLILGAVPLYFGGSCIALNFVMNTHKTLSLIFS